MSQYASYGKFGKKDAPVQGNIIELESAEHKQAILEQSRSTGQLVVVDIWGSFCGPCKACRPAYEALSLKYPSVIFCAEDVTMELTPEATVVPWFQFFGQGHQLEHVKGADMNVIEQTVLKYLQTKPSASQENAPPQNHNIRRPGGNPQINRNAPLRGNDMQRPNQIPHGIRR